ncbi:MAG: hypothetical protein DRJ47_00540 [Thermoprotei archaeon]|nr:MAG: hypothetical protein DRJ47_00540 [Thermoprotei archaeon]
MDVGGLIKVALTWPPSPEELEILQGILGDRVKLVYPKSRKNRFLELIELAEDADVIIGGYVPDSVILKAKKLKLIQTLSAGVDRFNFRLLKEKNIRLATASGANAITVAEMVFALMLAIAKKIVEFDRLMKKGKWAPYNPETASLELYGKTIGIIGLGNIGREVASRARAFGMKVMAIKRSVEPDLKEKLGLEFLGGPSDLDYVLKNSDFIVLTVPLTPETKGMIGERELEKVKPGAIIINVSRGPVIDEKALYKALKRGRLRGAGLDVWWAYPPDPKAPSPRKIHLLENVVATPHKAGWTLEARARALRLAAENVVNFIEGREVKNLVNLDLGY